MAILQIAWKQTRASRCRGKVPHVVLSGFCFVQNLREELGIGGTPWNGEGLNNGAKEPIEHGSMSEFVTRPFENRSFSFIGTVCPITLRRCPEIVINCPETMIIYPGKNPSVPIL